MEWVLQLMDEIDDAIGIVRYGWLGLYAAVRPPRAAASAKAHVPLKRTDPYPLR